MSIPQKDLSISGDATSGQSRPKEAQIGSPLEGANNELLAAVSTSSPRADTSTSASEHVSSQQPEEKESLKTIEAQRQAEVSTSAAIDTSTTQAGTAAIQFPLTTASAPGQTQGPTISGDFPGHNAAASPRPSSSGSSSSAVSLAGTPAPPHELRPPHLPSTQAREDDHEDSHIIYEASGVRIENCPRGYHVVIYAPNHVQVTLKRPARTVSSFEQVSNVPFHFKVMEDGGICALRMPEGTKASGMVVPTVQGPEEGAKGGGVIVEEIFTAVDGYTVTFRFAL